MGAEKKKFPKIRFEGNGKLWNTLQIEELVKRGVLDKPMDGNHGAIHPTSSDYCSDGIPFIMANDLLEGKLDFKTTKNISLELSENLKKGFAKSGDVLLTHKATIGETAIVPTLDNKPYIVLTPQVTYYRVLEPKSLFNLYLRYSFQSVSFKRQLLASGSGGTRLYIGITDQRALLLNLPTIEEQTQIGNFFQKMDEVIELQQKRLALTQDYKKSMLQKMFPQKGERVPRVRFGGFSEDWSELKLKEVAKIIGGGTPDTKISAYWNGDINWYAPAEIGKQRYVSESNRKITQEGLNKSSARLLPAKKSILFTSRAGIGDMAILAKEGCTNQGFQSLVVNDEVDVYFIFSMKNIITESALRIASGSTFLEISGKALGNLTFLFPCKEEQTAIGNFFQKLDEKIEAESAKLEKLQVMKKAMLQRMFV